MKVFLCKNCEHERYQCFACQRLGSAKTDPPEVKSLLPHSFENFKQTSWLHTQNLVSCRYFHVLQQIVVTFIMLNVLHSCSSLKMKQKQLSTRQRLSMGRNLHVQFIDVIFANMVKTRRLRSCILLCAGGAQSHIIEDVCQGNKNLFP